ncbi:MAG: PfkB protein [Patescibacteria group bacterium]|nr:PfkB protein [Patescibacteria group bacterium]
MDTQQNFDLVAIGDTVIDAFIRVSVGHVQETAHGAELCIPYGAKVPYDSVVVLPAVGNSANAAVSASRLGLNAALLTYLGNDKHGKECLEKLEVEKVATKFIQLEDGKRTNYHYVLWYGDDRTILIKHEEFTPVLPDLGTPKWVYLSSLGKHTLPMHHELIKYLESHPEVKLAFQPGTFQLGFKQEIADLYKKTEVVCMNKEEAQGLLNTEEHDLKKLMDMLSDWGPKIIIITDGHNGSYMKHEGTYFNMPIYPDEKPPYERTGAGDAFFSTFVSFLARGFDAPYAIVRAPINSMNVVQHVGAQEGLLTEEKLEEYLSKAPADYILKTLD